MPAEGVELAPEGSLLTTDEIVRLGSLFVAAGVTKIRLTGGEPTVRKDIEAIVERLGALPGLRTLAMTTNGLLLRSKLPKLQKAGLNLLNISLDTLDSAKFTQITRRQGFERVVEGINLAVSLGYDPVKVNCVIMRGLNEAEVPDFVEWTRHVPLEVRFIEYMPFDGNKWTDTKLVPYEELIRNIEAKYGKLERVQDEAGNTSKTFRVPGFRGTVGFITSMTDHFCGTCTRLRLMADGSLKVCLFGSTEISLRDAMRAGSSDDDLGAMVKAAVWRKKARHAGMHAIAATKNRPMITIGG
jgi:cyclic pyranopterin phosphate synthase